MPGGVRLGPALLAAIAATGIAAAPAQAITRGKAEKVAVRALAPNAQTVVYGLPKPLGSTRAVWALDPDGKERGRQRLRPLGRRTWLFWADREFGAKFEHPSTLLLVDDRSGRVVRRTNLTWWPMVGTRPAAFVRRPDDPRYWVKGPPAPTSAPAALRQAPAPVAFGADALKGECILTIGAFGDRRTSADFTRIHAMGTRLAAAGTGLQIWRSGGPTDPDGKEQAPGGGDLARDVASVVSTKGCIDVMLFVDGHGAKNGPALVNVGFRVRKVGAEVAEWSAANVTSDDIAAIMRAHPSIGFKLKIDACYAGRFVLDLPKDEHPNLRIIEASSNAEETSLFSLPAVTADGKRVRSRTNNPGNRVIEVDDPDNPGKKKRVYDAANGLSEFSNGNFSALETFITTPALIEDAVAQGGDLWARALEYASANSTAQDFAAQQGLTHPVTVVNIPTGPAGGGGGSTTPTPLTTAAELTWVHTEPGVRSQLCVRVRTTPARSGSVRIRVTGPAVESGGDVTLTLDSTGEAFTRVSIQAYGEYTATADTTATDGATSSTTQQQTVDGTAGTCPPPG